MLRLFVGAAAVALVAGCGGSGGAVPVAGRVAWPGGDLAGHMVEVAQVADPTVRGFGTIGPDGRFTLERLIDGRTAPGLPPGEYKARLILNDEGDGQVKKPKIPARYLNPNTAGWPVTVPAAGDVALTVAAK